MRQFAQAIYLASATGASELSVAVDPMLDRLRARVAERPDDAVGWRLLGVLHERRGELPWARDAYTNAVRFDPENASARCGLGRVLIAMDQPGEAEGHLQEAVWLAPESDYAREAQSLLQSLHLAMPEPSPEESERPADSLLVQPANFVTDWLKGPALTDAAVVPQESSALSFSMDVGLQFNSNVELAPISRQLSPLEDGSFQAFMAPDVEYAIVDNAQWRLASQFYGFFNFNEGHLHAYNLQHYEPGIWVRALCDVESHTSCAASGIQLFV